MQLDKARAFLIELKYSGLTAQQKRTLRGQVINGHLDAAMKGYKRLMEAKNNSRKDETA